MLFEYNPTTAIRINEFIDLKLKNYSIAYKVYEETTKDDISLALTAEINKLVANQLVDMISNSFNIITTRLTFIRAINDNYILSPLKHFGFEM